MMLIQVEIKLIDGHNIKGLTTEMNFSRCISEWFFRIHGCLKVTIMENIRYGRA